MRKIQEKNFQVEVVYKESPDKNDRLRQLWDLLLSLPDPEEANNKNKKNYEYQKAGNIQHDQLLFGRISHSEGNATYRS